MMSKVKIKNQYKNNFLWFILGCLLSTIVLLTLLLNYIPLEFYSNSVKQDSFKQTARVDSLTGSLSPQLKSSDDLQTVAEKAKQILIMQGKISTYNYIAGTENLGEITGNNDSFKKYKLLPRFLVNVNKSSSSLEILGHQISSPILIAPSASHKLVNKDGELATARAAANENTIMIASCLSSYSLEEIAKAAPGSPKWLQLYVYKNRNIVENLIRRAEKSGYSAIVLTVDVPTSGYRLNSLLQNLHGSIGVIKPGNFDFSDLYKSTNSEVSNGDDIYDPTLTWDIIDWLRTKTKLPIIVKGILTPDDARKAIKHGASAIVVSNHGDRQMDSPISTIDALPAIVKEVKGQVPILIDGGIRSGEDVFKAIALGANAVLVGRPILWGLACDGEQGAAHVLNRLKDEFNRTMRIMGCRSLAEIHKNGHLLLRYT